MSIWLLPLILELEAFATCAVGRARIETYLRALRQAAKSRDQPLTQLFEHLILITACLEPPMCSRLPARHELQRSSTSSNQSGLSVPFPR